MKTCKKIMLIFIMILSFGVVGNFKKFNKVYAAEQDFNNSLFIEDSKIHGLKRKLNRLGTGNFVIETDYYSNSNILDNIKNETGKLDNSKFSKIFLILGANEIESMSDVDDITSFLLYKYAGNPIYITSILPVSNQYKKESPEIKNKKIEEINQLIIKKCNLISNLNYVDISDGMLDEKGNLKSEYSDDTGINLKSNDVRNLYMKNLKSSILLVNNPQSKFTNNVLLNPGKGLFYYDQGNVYKNSSGEYKGELSETEKSLKYKDFKYLISCGYYRFDLGDVYELKDYEDKLRRAIRKYQGDGKYFAFRIRTSNSTSNSGSNLPNNLFSNEDIGIFSTEGDLGVKFLSYNINGINRQYFWNAIAAMQTIPDWKDESYINAIDYYLDVLENRLSNDIDGNGKKGNCDLRDSIAFVEAGFYGNFGEQQINAFGSEPISASELRDLYIKPLKDRFPNTWVLNAACDQTTENRYESMYKNYARQTSQNSNYTKGVGLRCDGILDTSITEYVGSWAYQYAPVAAEFCPVEKEGTGFYYKNDRFNGKSWREELEDEIKIQKLSYLEFIPVMFFDEDVPDDSKRDDDNNLMKNKEFWEYIANKLGYYFKIKDVTYTNSSKKYPMTVGDKLNIKLSIENDGVAKLYENCDGYVGIFDTQNKLVDKYKIKDINLNSIDSGKTEQREFYITLANKMSKGEYKISLGLFKDEKDENPDYLLANDTQIENSKWYEIGKIYFTPDMVLLGDVDKNGKIDLVDVFLAYNTYIKGDSASEQTKKLADVNKDGKVDLLDVFLIYSAYIEQYDYGYVEM